MITLLIGLVLGVGLTILVIKLCTKVAADIKDLEA